MSYCKDCKSSGGRCGYQLIRPICYCKEGSYSRKCPMPPTKLSRTKSKVKIRKVFMALQASAFGTMIGLIVVIFSLKRKDLSRRTKVLWKRTDNVKKGEDLLKNNGSVATKIYSYHDIKKITSSFKHQVGRGGCGSVFKGMLLDGREVAVKVLDEPHSNGEEFINEVASITRTSHVNVVALFGFCFDGSRRALVYEFMPYGSLEKFIYNDKSLETCFHLGWETLFQIAVGIARGLEYLHRGCNTRILHFDIKPHNILLDKDFCPKISDFGLAKLCPRKESSISIFGARGTFGYIAPEVFSRNFGPVSHKSDVYSYGMMALEMIGGRKNSDAGVEHLSEIYFPHWIYKRLKLQEDLGLHGVTSEVEEKITRKMLLVGLWCIQASPPDRPSMSRVVEMLEGDPESLITPPQPFLLSPTTSPPGLPAADGQHSCNYFIT